MSINQQILPSIINQYEGQQNQQQLDPNTYEGQIAKAILKEQLVRGEEEYRRKHDQLFQQRVEQLENDWSVQHVEFNKLQSRTEKKLLEVTQKEKELDNRGKLLEGQMTNQLNQHKMALDKQHAERESKAGTLKAVVERQTQQIKDMESELQREQKRAKNFADKNEKLERELDEVRENRNVQEVVKLKAELAVLKHHYEEMQTKYDDAMKSRDHFKKSMYELAKNLDATSQRNNNDQENIRPENSASKTHFNSTAETRKVSEPPSALKPSDIRQALQQLNTNFAAPSPTPVKSNLASLYGSSPARSNVDVKIPLPANIQHIQQQRQSLLDSGNYTENDKAIKYFDQKIETMMKELELCWFDAIFDLMKFVF